MHVYKKEIEVVKVSKRIHMYIVSWGFNCNSKIQKDCEGTVLLGVFFI